MTLDEAIRIATMTDTVPKRCELLEAGEVLAAEVERLNTWGGLMSLLDKYYPADVFDGLSGDEGPNTITLIRAVDKLRAEVDRMKANLLRKARLYQADDGSPGPLSNQWGWREMAKNLREAAQAMKGQDDDR